ncbi:hypothetical protein, conserved [Entamoeba histolytica]
MGVAHLTTFLRHLEKGFPLFLIAEKYYKETTNNTKLIIDGSGFMFQILEECNSDMFSLDQFFKKMYSICLLNHIQLIFVFDGMTQPIKFHESISRLIQQSKENKKFFSKPSTVNELPITIFSGLKRSIKYLLLKYGFECVRAYAEADPVIIEKSVEVNAYGVVTSDSDFYLSKANIVFNTSNFIKLFLKVINERNHPNLKIYFKGIRTSDVISYFNFNKDFIPLFSCICGNDFTKSLSRKLRKRLNIVENINVINDVVNYFRKTEFTPITLLNFLQSTLSKNDFDLLKAALKQINRMCCITPPSIETIRKEEVSPLPPEKFPNCYYSFSITLSAISVASFPSLRCWDKFDSPAFVCSKIRSLLYSLVQPNSEVIEYFDNKSNDVRIGHSIKTGINVDGDLCHWLDLLKFPIKSIQLVQKWKDNCVEFWKIMTFITMKYIQIYSSDFSNFAFCVVTWYSLCSQYPNVYQPPEYRPKRKVDHRMPIHLFTYIHGISYHLLEIVIDRCDIDYHFVEQFYSPNLYTFSKIYDKSNTDTLFLRLDELCKNDEIFNEICDALNLKKN